MFIVFNTFGDAWATKLYDQLIPAWKGTLTIDRSGGPVPRATLRAELKSAEALAEFLEDLAKAGQKRVFVDTIVEDV
jgi:hypothetical protein